MINHQGFARLRQAAGRPIRGNPRYPRPVIWTAVVYLCLPLTIRFPICAEPRA